MHHVTGWHFLCRKEITIRFRGIQLSLWNRNTAPRIELSCVLVWWCTKFPTTNRAKLLLRQFHLYPDLILLRKHSCHLSSAYIILHQLRRTNNGYDSEINYSEAITKRILQSSTFILKFFVNFLDFKHDFLLTTDWNVNYNAFHLK